jgi:hypothetical protein
LTLRHQQQAAQQWLADHAEAAVELDTTTQIHYWRNRLVAFAAIPQSGNSCSARNHRGLPEGEATAERVAAAATLVFFSVVAAVVVVLALTTSMLAGTVELGQTAL